MTTPNKAQHTPGPWTENHDETAERLNCILAADGYPVCDNIYGQNKAQAAANARLIAAAPELLRIVRDYAENADCGNGGEHSGETRDKAENCWHCQAVAIVAQVEGRAE